jgi:hypothetical protein
MVGPGWGAELELPPVPGLDFGQVRRIELAGDGQYLGGRPQFPVSMAREL